MINFFIRYLRLTAEQVAQTSVYLATSRDVENVTGKYWKRAKRCHPVALPMTKPPGRSCEKSVAKWLRRVRRRLRPSVFEGKVVQGTYTCLIFEFELSSNSQQITYGV